MNIVFCFNHFTKLLWKELNELRFFKLVGNEFHIVILSHGLAREHSRHYTYTVKHFTEELY